MISMGSIWDRTLEVVRGRTGILVGIAALLIALPAALSGGFIQYVTAYAPQLVAVVGLASIIVGVLQIWGGLALVAVASDPAVDQGTGIARGGARLPLTIGLYILLGIAAVILFVPLFAVVGVSVLRAFPGGHYDADLLPGTMTAASSASASCTCWPRWSWCCGSARGCRCCCRWWSTSGAASAALRAAGS